MCHCRVLLHRKKSLLIRYLSFEYFLIYKNKTQQSQFGNSAPSGASRKPDPFRFFSNFVHLIIDPRLERVQIFRSLEVLGAAYEPIKNSVSKLKTKKSLKKNYLFFTYSFFMGLKKYAKICFRCIFYAEHDGAIIFHLSTRENSKILKIAEAKIAQLFQIFNKRQKFYFFM